MIRMYFRATMIEGNVNQRNTSLWIWALASGALLVLFPSDASCLIATGALILQQLVQPMRWDGFRWFVLLWIGVWANCFWEEEMFAFDALRFAAVGWVIAIGILPSLRHSDLRERGVDILILGGLFALNHWVSWDAGISLTRNALILSVSLGLIAAGKHTSCQNLKTALVQLWMVLTIQCIVAMLLSPETAWIYSGAYRFQGFQSNPNSLSHPFLILSIAVVLLCKTNRKRLFAIWSTSIVMLFATGTRAALLAFLMFGAVLFFRELELRKATKRGLLVSSGVVGFVLILLERGGLTWMRLGSLAIGGGRFNAWPLALEEVGVQPWLGHGAGYELQWFFAMAPYFEWVNHIGNSHNAFLALLMDYGVVGGLGLFLWMSWRFGWFSNRKAWLIGLPLMVELFFENWLTAPLSSSFLLMAATSMCIQQLPDFDGAARQSEVDAVEEDRQEPELVLLPD